MRGAVFLGNRNIEIRNFPDPTPGPGEVVIKMRASGMCGSDLKFYRSPPGEAQKALGLGGDAEPFIAGHEPCGEIVARGAGVSEREAPTGQRVMNHHYVGCGRCKHCRVGWSQLCRAGITVFGVTGDGAHARYMKVPARTNVPLPEELSFEEGAAVSCGTGTAYGALKRLDVSGRDTLAVFGQGPVGLSATMLGVAMGARVRWTDLRMSLAGYPEPKAERGAGRADCQAPPRNRAPGGPARRRPPARRCRRFPRSSPYSGPDDRPPRAPPVSAHRTPAADRLRPVRSSSWWHPAASQRRSRKCHAGRRFP